MTRQEKINACIAHCYSHTCPIDNPENATCKIGKSHIGSALCYNSLISNMRESELDMMMKCIDDDSDTDNRPAEQTSEPDEVNHPAHYQGKVECIDEMVAVFGKEAVINFCTLNVWKYRYRADKKGGDKDREKADWYMEKIIELKNGA